jgi:hypothetical protein
MLFTVDSYYIFTDKIIYENSGVNYSLDIVEEIISFNEKSRWIGYIVIICTLFIKLMFVSFCIIVGAIFTNTSFSITNIYHAVIYSEIIFLISQKVYTLNLLLNRDVLTFDNFGNFFPLSMLSFIGIGNVAEWLHYPLQTLNLFEVAYVLCISWLLSKQWKPNFVESLNIVIPSYGIGLLIWMVLVVFLTLQVS